MRRKRAYGGASGEAEALCVRRRKRGKRNLAGWDAIVVDGTVEEPAASPGLLLSFTADEVVATAVDPLSSAALLLLPSAFSTSSAWKIKTDPVMMLSLIYKTSSKVVISLIVNRWSFPFYQFFFIDFKISICKAYQTLLFHEIFEDSNSRWMGNEKCLKLLDVEKATIPTFPELLAYYVMPENHEKLSR